MAKFAGEMSRRRPVSTVINSAVTGEGGRGVKYDSRTELWNLTTAAMVGGEKSFYENGEVRDARLASLVRSIVAEPGGFEWLSRFVPFLRREMFMRTATVMVAAEAARARQVLVRAGSAPAVESGYSVRALVASAIDRMDEFGEFIGYWRMRFGRAIPGGVQRGLADALRDSLTEYNAMKYDGNARAYRIGDILNCYADLSRSAKELAYQPRVSLEDGIRDLTQSIDLASTTDCSAAVEAELRHKGLLLNG